MDEKELKELKQWLKTYFIDMFLSFIFWGVVFGIGIGIAILLK